MEKKEQIAKRMRKADHKATRRVGKVFDGGMKPLSKDQILSSDLASTKVHRDMKIWRQHAGLED